jgi:hypothetical protein
LATLASFAAELKSWFSQIDPLATLPLVQRAYSDIRNSREWSFLKQTGSWFAPSIITGGTVHVTQFSATVVGDATASPLWLAVALPAPPALPLTLRQFRVVGGPIYNIIAYDGVSTITLDRPYAEQSGAASSYMIYQPYVPVPSVDFKRSLSMVDPINMYRFRYRNLFRTQKEVDRVDPNRQNFSIPIWMAAHDYVLMPGDTQQRPRFEAWPGPVQQIGYVWEYMSKGDAVTPTQVLPGQIPDQLIMARARHYGHELVANQPDVDVKTKAYHLNALTRVDAEYRDLLNRAQLDDNSIFDSRVSNEETGPTYSGPLDSNYLQGHEIFLID